MDPVMSCMYTVLSHMGTAILDLAGSLAMREINKKDSGNKTTWLQVVYHKAGILQTPTDIPTWCYAPITARALSTLVLFYFLDTCPFSAN